MKETDDPLARATEEPQVSELIREFNGCTPLNDTWNRYLTNEQIRDCRWIGQSVDGKKHDLGSERAFPFDGASDSRVFVIDDVINEMVSVEWAAFWRALVRVHGGQGADIEGASYANKLLEWMLNSKQFTELVQEVELHSQHVHTYGWGVLYVTWRQEHCLQLVTAKMQEIMQMAAQAQAAMQQGQQNEQLAFSAQLPQLILDESMMDLAVQFLTQHIQGLTPKRARKSIIDLRKTGQAEIPMPYTRRNEPCIRALKPYEEVLIPNDTTDIQNARVVFVKEWVSEQDLLARINDEDYDPDWVDAAVNQKGNFSTWPSSINDLTTLGTMSATNVIWQKQPDDPRIEIVHAYVRQVDEDNIPGIYVTTFHPLIATKFGDRRRPMYARHQLLPYRHGKMPFVVRKRENRARAITSSRGLPEVLHTTQRSIKVQEDSCIDNTSLTTLPPIITSDLMGVDYRFSPAGQVPIPRSDMGTGREPHFMQLGGSNPKLALELMDRLEKRVDRYSGRRRADEPADGAMAKAQMHVQSNLISWTEAFQQEFALLRQYLPPQEYMRITGAPQPMANDANAIREEADFILTFDARELDTDFVESKLKAIKDVILPIDAAGVIDRSKLVSLLLKAIDPTLAKELVMDQNTASKQLYNGVKSDMLGMMGGFESDYVENDPTAERQLQYADAILKQNPKLQKVMQSDEQTRALMENWFKNRQQSVAQEQNKVVGRIGVQPQQQAVGQ